MSTHTITADVAAELYESNDGDVVDGWTRITAQSVDSGRWLEHYWLVITRGEGCFGIGYSLGLTESQENELPWEEYPDEPVTLTPLVGVPVTTTQYLTAKQYEAHLQKEGSR